MKFEELAKELDDTYSVGYEDRAKALGGFGRKYIAAIWLPWRNRTIR